MLAVDGPNVLERWACDLVVWVERANWAEGRLGLGLEKSSDKLMKKEEKGR